MTKLNYMAAAATVASLALGTAAQAETFSISTFLSPGHEITVYQHTQFADRVRDRSGGDIDFEVFSGGSLLPAGGTIEGVANGVAQVGVWAAAYAPSVFPIQTAIGDIGAVVTKPTVLAFSYSDMILHERDMDEWQNAGLIFGAGVGVPVYHYLCTRAGVGSLESLAGLKARTSGATWARLSTALGVVPVNLPASEMYTSLERGAVDCICGDVTHLTGGEQFGELIKSIAMIDLAVPFTTAAIMYDTEFWQARSQDQRKLLLEEGFRSMANIQAAFARLEKENLAWAKEQGIELNEPDEAAQAAYDAWVADGMGGGIEFAKNNLGIDDPQPYYDRLQSYIDKWEPLLADVDPEDAEALFALLQEHALNDIDYSAYGME